MKECIVIQPMRQFGFRALFAAISVSSFTANPGQVVINEIWNGSTVTDEYVEFYNTTASPVDLSAWTFMRCTNNQAAPGTTLYTFPGSGGSNTTVIPAHGYYVIGDAPIGVTTNGNYTNAISS